MVNRSDDVVDVRVIFFEKPLKAVEIVVGNVFSLEANEEGYLSRVFMSEPRGFDYKGVECFV